MSNESKVTNIPRCAVCSGTINAGTGLFVVDGGVHHVHSGACARKAGAFPGSAVAWGERAALASAMIATDGITEAEAAEKVLYREPEPEGGFAVVGLLLQVVIVVLSLAVIGLSIAGYAPIVQRAFDGLGVAAHAAVAADRVPGGVSR